MASGAGFFSAAALAYKGVSSLETFAYKHEICGKKRQRFNAFLHLFAPFKGEHFFQSLALSLGSAI